MKPRTTLVILKASEKQATGGKQATGEKQAKNPEVEIPSLIVFILKLNYIVRENAQDV